MDIPTDNVRRYSTESCQTITSHAIITDGIYPSVMNTDGCTNALYPSVFHRELPNNYQPCHNYWRIIRRYVRWNCRRIYSVGNVPAGNFFFCARVSVCKTVSVLSVCFFFICDRISDGNGFYRQLLYWRTCSVGEAVGNYFTDGFHSCDWRTYSVGKTV